jgi:hypothetical protein
MSRSYRFRILNLILLVLLGTSGITIVHAQSQRGPSDVVREFYKAMHDRRFKDAWAVTVYRPAAEGLTAEQVEDLRPFFEAQAADVPAQIQIDGEKINGSTAQVFVHLPPTDSTPQVTSQPVDLINSGGGWIIGTLAEQETVKKAGSRYFLDAFIDRNEDNMAQVLKRLIGMEAVFAAASNGVFGDPAALVRAGLMSDDMFDPRLSGYNFHLTINGKAYLATAEPLHYGRTARLSYWMDQTGAIKSADNGGKPLVAK